MKRGIKTFFALARERHGIYLKKQAGLPRPWTKDTIFNTYRFTCVFRELDRTTEWFRTRVREPMSKPRSDTLLLATVVFRMFNRTESGEAVFCDDDLLGGFSAFDKFAEKGDTRPLKHALVHRLGKGPYVTGSYIISSPTGMTKLDGVLHILSSFHKRADWREVTRHPPATLEEMWNWLRKFEYMGPFHSYEIVSDLRHTPLLNKAADIMTWANPGPGARRGLNRVMGRDVSDTSLSRDELIEELRELLHYSTDAALWPKEWPTWEMRECEHWSCETDKYLRTKNGEGRPRGVYR